MDKNNKELQLSKRFSSKNIIALSMIIVKRKDYSSQKYLSIDAKLITYFISFFSSD